MTVSAPPVSFAPVSVSLDHAVDTRRDRPVALAAILNLALEPREARP